MNATYKYTTGVYAVQGSDIVLLSDCHCMLPGALNGTLHWVKYHCFIDMVQFIGTCFTCNFL